MKSANRALVEAVIRAFELLSKAVDSWPMTIRLVLILVVSGVVAALLGGASLGDLITVGRSVLIGLLR
jgi:hypothetical protein